jgi:DNA-directed RNA polymerase specialized sigma subunit
MCSILKKYNLLDKKDDYIDLCYIGYTRALNNYDDVRASFSSYAYKCMENEILKELKRNNTKKRQCGGILDIDFIYENGENLNDKIASDVDLEMDLIKSEDINKIQKAINCLKRISSTKSFSKFVLLPSDLRFSKYSSHKYSYSLSAFLSN